jgi:putative glutathione S-transferase
LFDALDWVEGLLAENRYLDRGPRDRGGLAALHDASAVRSVYHLHFKCNRRRLIDYPNLWAYTRELFQWPGVADTVNFDHIVRHYHYSHESINPHRIVPINPEIDWWAPHGREGLKAA